MIRKSSVTLGTYSTSLVRSTTSCLVSTYNTECWPLAAFHQMTCLLLSFFLLHRWYPSLTVLQAAAISTVKGTLTVWAPESCVATTNGSGRCCLHSLFLCHWNENNQQKQFERRKLSVGSEHQRTAVCSGVEHVAKAMWRKCEADPVHTVEDQKQREQLATEGCNFQKSTLGDPLLPSRIHFLKAPQPPKTAHQLGNKCFSMGDISYSSHSTSGVMSYPITDLEGHLMGIWNPHFLESCFLLRPSPGYYPVFTSCCCRNKLPQVWLSWKN